MSLQMYYKRYKLLRGVRGGTCFAIQVRDALLHGLLGVPTGAWSMLVAAEVLLCFLPTYTPRFWKDTFTR